MPNAVSAFVNLAVSSAAMSDGHADGDDGATATAMPFMCGGNFSDHFVANCPPSLSVKEL